MTENSIQQNSTSQVSQVTHRFKKFRNMFFLYFLYLGVSMKKIIIKDKIMNRNRNNKYKQMWSFLID